MTTKILLISAGLIKQKMQMLSLAFKHQNLSVSLTTILPKCILKYDNNERITKQTDNGREF